MPETEEVSADIQAILSREDHERALMECVAYFDRWYEERLRLRAGQAGMGE
jgi:hypothetical protein